MDGSHDWWLFRENNVPGSIGIARVREQAPVHVSTVPNIGVVVLCRRCLQDLLHKTLRFFRPLEEQLDYRSENLQLGL